MYFHRRFNYSPLTAQLKAAEMELLRLLDTSQLELLPAQVPVALDSESSSEDEDVDSTESMTRQMQIQLAR